MSKRKSGRNKGRFAGIPHFVMESKAYSSLPTLSKALLMELAGQYSSRNNGYLSLTRDDLKRRGYPTPSSNQKAIEKLLEAGLITRTIEGGICRGKKFCHLYAINWQPADERQDRPFQKQPLKRIELMDLLSGSGRVPLLIRKVP